MKTADATPATTAPGDRVRRSASNRMVAGVAAGLGEHWGVDPALVRMAFVVLCLCAGTGAVLYVLAWSVTAEEPERPRHAARPPSLRQGTAFGLIVIGGVFLLRAVGLWFGDPIGIPIVLASVGWAVIYARSGDEGRTRLTFLVSGFGDETDALTRGRVAAGGLLVLAGMGVFLASRGALGAVGPVLLSMLVTAAGLAVIFGPMLQRLVEEAGAERRERIRSEERAEMAAHLHDSVLQTLALIQRDPQASRRIVNLARSQERELRVWLYGRPEVPGGESTKAAVEAVADTVERDHEVTVEAVVVGDRPLEERTQAVVHACREAIVNAARHSGSDEVSVYVEIEPEAIEAFVRDRGVGFAPDDVPDDRRGIADSIRGRLQRYGGTVAITSRPGEGTEVALRMPMERA
jgi:signal transduction histidine kinase